jgi:anhydro-N-acetylmuramic acid kinase
MSELYIGLMSGTSADGIDAALVDLAKAQPKLIATHYQEFTPQLRREILALCQAGPDEINRMGELDVKLGKAFASMVKTLLENSKTKASSIQAIGSHGQTIRHNPAKHFSYQIGDPNIIAAETGITTAADFRRRDMALGGQGAPLVPAFHQAIFNKKNTNRSIINIGGIANVTLLTSAGLVFGFDTGPGNSLLDAWTEKYLNQSHDDKGEWAAKGKVHLDILNNLLNDPFFKLPPPKSTGREYFNLPWLQKYLPHTIKPIDVQATLVELTAQTIIDAISQHVSHGEILVCGGGVHNDFLMSRLNNLGSNFVIKSTIEEGVDPDWVEAIAFAWFAKQTLKKKPASIPAVTGSERPALLGGIYFP